MLRWLSNRMKAKSFFFLCVTLINWKEIVMLAYLLFQYTVFLLLRLHFCWYFRLRSRSHRIHQIIFGAFRYLFLLFSNPQRKCTKIFPAKHTFCEDEFRSRNSFDLSTLCHSIWTADHKEINRRISLKLKITSN